MGNGREQQARGSGRERDREKETETRNAYRATAVVLVIIGGSLVYWRPAICKRTAHINHSGRKGKNATLRAGSWLLPVASSFFLSCLELSHNNYISGSHKN
jgi:hypothetical protein